MQATCAEKRKLNQLAPISRLHPEIFSSIFCHVRDSITGLVNTWIPHCTKNWTGLTHVCHAWRDIAINTPTLWTKLFFSVEDHLEWVQEMLRRSRQCSLSVVVSKVPQRASSPRAVGPILQGLKNDMHRFRELVLRYIPIDDLHNFFSNSHTHRLEYLHIVSDGSSDTSSDGSSPDPPANGFTLNDEILHPDSLRYLSIDNCGLDFHSAFLPSLTDLDLIDIDEDCRISSITFVAVLAAIPGLERLRLGGFLKTEEVEDVERYVPVTNKTHFHLTFLSLTCHVLGEMVHFLCAITLPSSCQLRLGIMPEGPEIAPAFQFITSWLSNHFQSAQSFHSFQTFVRNWSIEDTSHIVSDLQVTGFHGLSGLEFPYIRDDKNALLSASVLLCHDSEAEDEMINNLWLSFLKSLPLSNVEAKNDSTMTLPDRVWVEFFAPLTTLKTIIIDSGCYPTFFHIASPGSSNAVAPFPALSSIFPHLVKHSRLLG